MGEDLLDFIYEAGAFPDRWPDTLERIARGVGALGGNLIRNTGTAISILSSPSVEEVTREFEREGWNRQNSRVARLVARSPYPGFLTDLDLHTAEEIRTLPMYTQFLTPRGADAGAATIIQGFNHDVLALAFEAFENHAAASLAVPALNQLRPHMARAAALSSQVTASRASTLVDSLGALGASVALLDARGKMVAATELFSGSIDHLILTGSDRIRLLDPVGDRRLAAVLAEFHGAPSGASIAVRDRQGIGQAVLHLLPATGNARDLFSNVSIFAVLARLENRLLPDTDIIGALFDLTPAEARVARAVAEGKRPDEIARASNLSVETIRAHLKRTFVKTSTTHQADLAILINSLG